MRLEQVLRVTAHDRPTTAVLVSPRNHAFVTCSLDGHSRIFDWRSGELRHDLVGPVTYGPPRQYAQALMTNVGQDWLYVGPLAELHVFDLSDGAFKASISVPQPEGRAIDGVRGLAAAPNSCGFASCSGNGVLQLWDDSSLVEKEIFFPDVELHCVQYSHDSRWLGVAFDRDQVMVFDLEAEAGHRGRYRPDPHRLPFYSLPTESGAYSLRFGSATQLFVGAQSGTVQSWAQLSDGRWGRYDDVVQHDGALTGLAMLGPHLVTGCEAGLLIATRPNSSEVSDARCATGVGIEAIATSAAEPDMVYVGFVDGSVAKYHLAA